MPTRNTDHARMTTRHMRGALSFLMISLCLLGGCASREGQTPSDMAWMRTELYFGTRMPEGKTVSPDAWKAFLDTEITPLFPDGLTVIPATGQWRGTDGTVISETTRVLVILHPQGGDARQKCDVIRKAYCEQFKQDCVLLATQPARVSF